MINHASQDGRVCNHPGLLKYGIESYIAVPLSRLDGSYFGTLCALDPAPQHLDESSFGIFELMAQLIAYELEAEDERIDREAQIGALNDIISIAGHDLRQPLTSLLLRSQMMARQVQRQMPDAGIMEGLQEQVATIRRTISLTDKLLDISRLETQNFTLDIAELDLVQLVEQVITDVKATSPNHSFEIRLPTSLNIEGDGIRLNQVIRNLLDNAVKYSPYSKEPIKVVLSTLGDLANPIFQNMASTSPTEASKRRQVVLQIADSGLGVKESDLGHLFERQFRTQEAKDAAISGSGLGLYVSKQIISAHGGEIWAERVEGGGLSITFTLPVDPL